MTEVIQPLPAAAAELVPYATPDVTIVFPVQTQKAGSVERKTVASQIRDNTDFISLASFGSTNQAKRTNNDKPLLQTGKKKKKKTQEPKKKSNLMDFLSSLND